MMLDRMLVSDIQEEISTIQLDLKNLNDDIVENKQNENWIKENQYYCASSIKAREIDKLNIDGSNQLNRSAVFAAMKGAHHDEKKTNFEKEMDSLAASIASDTIMVKHELKVERDLNPTSTNEYNNSSVTKSYKPMQNNNVHTSSSGMTSHSTSNVSDIDVKPTFQQISNKENTLPSLDMANFEYDLLDSTKSRNQNAYNDVKKELENLDIESEITPSYIIKKCDPEPNRDVVHSPLSSSDFDYLCSPSDSGTNNTTNSRRKDELISCDKEPYDEWLCIQKELNLISDKRSNDHLNIDGFMESTLRTFSNDDEENACSSSKLSVEKEFSDLFSQRTNDAHSLDDAKTDMERHLPLSELFNDTIVNNTVVDSDNKSSVENRLENMFGDNSEFDKTNDLVESRLEELFHGSSSPTHPTVNTNQNLR